MEATAGEIHAYPLRPEGFEEPLFHTADSRKRILEHFARSGWLFRASEYRSSEYRTSKSGRLKMKPLEAASEATVRSEGKIIASWREVDRWWEPDGGVDVIWRRIETQSGRQEVRAEPTSQPASAA